MKNFGIYKSKIEKLLVDSYSNGTIKENFVKFRDYILSDKSMVEIFYLYDQLSSKKGLSNELAKEYLDECVSKIKKNKISKDKILQLENWTKDIKTQNIYENIDDLFDEDVLKIESKIRSKKFILETISSKETQDEKNVINIPLKSAMNIANQKLSDFVSNLTEEEKKEFLTIAKMEESNLRENFNLLKESTNEKLRSILDKETDIDTKTKIEETINKIKIESPSRVSYYRLKKLSETI